MIEISTGVVQPSIGKSDRGDLLRAIVTPSSSIRHVSTLEDSLEGAGHLVEFEGVRCQFRFFDGSSRDVNLVRKCFEQFPEELVAQRYHGRIGIDRAVECVQNSLWTILVICEEEVIGWGELVKYQEYDGRRMIGDPTKVAAGIVLREDYHGMKIGFYLSNLLFNLAQTLEGIDHVVAMVNGGSNNGSNNRAAYEMSKRLNVQMGGLEPKRNAGEVIFMIPLRGQIEP